MNPSPARDDDDASSPLAPGTLCTLVAGCPENIGLLVRDVMRIGRTTDREDAYLIATLSGRKFRQLWQGPRLASGGSTEAVTDRWKLRPLVSPPQEEGQDAQTQPGGDGRATPSGVPALHLSDTVAHHV